MIKTHYSRIFMGIALALFAVLFLSTTRLDAQVPVESQHAKDFRQQQMNNESETSSDAAEDAQKDWPHKLTFGAGGGLNYNMADGGSSQYMIDGNAYGWGHGYGPDLHLLLEVPIGGNFMFAPRVDYDMISTAFTDGVAIASGAATIPQLAFDIRNLGVDLNMKFAVNRLHFILGPTVALMMKKTWAHGTYTASDNTWADIPGTHNTFVAVAGGAGYDAPLNSKNTMWLTPEIVYSYPVVNLGDANHGDLLVSTLRGALSLKFDVSPSEAPPPQPPPPARPLSVTITAQGVLPNGKATSAPVIPEKDIVTRTSMPVLPYIFFSENSSEIPARYSQNGATGFDEKQLQGKDALEVNHEVLDIVGSRMKEHPELNVTITGTNCNSGAEHHNLDLSKARAMAVKTYLMNTWGIADNRITTDSRNLPELPTNPATQAGMEENRRAEIIDSKTDDPVQLSDNKSEFDGETLIRYETTVNNPDNIPVSFWRITLDQNGTQIGSAESGSGSPQAVINSRIANADQYEGKPVHYTLEVTDANGKTYTADGTTTIEKQATSNVRHLERYAMLSFDFDSSLINDHAKKMLDLIRESINKDATAVRVNGFCDITGTDEYNQALSERRANSAADALRASGTLPAEVTIEGHGRNDPKFPNDLPEGRQLNRRVEVDIAKSE